MLSVIHPGWLLLAICGTILLLISYNLLMQRFPAFPPTEYPLHPHISEQLPTPFFALAYEVPNNAPLASTTSAKNSAPPPTETLSLHAFATQPTCYPAPNAGYTCLGLVWNDGGSEVENGVVRVRLLDAQQRVMAEDSAALEQRSIPLRTAAPYRVQFQQVGTEYRRASADVINIGSSALDIMPIAIRSQQATTLPGGRTRIEAWLHNDNRFVAQDVRLIATLFDEQERVIGYRVLELPGALDTGTERHVTVEVIPHTTAERITHRLYADARPRRE